MKMMALSDVGRVRETNQDYYYICEENDEIKLAILADGMGGYNGGEIASKLATETTRDYIKNNLYSTLPDKKEIEKLIISAIEYANMVVYEKSKEDQNLNGMGTTLEVCLIYNNMAYIAHIGDSRVYLIRDNKIDKLTTDHSYVENLIKEGKITEEEAVNHPKKNIITKALGCTAYVEPDIMQMKMEKQDIIVMTSDGLTNKVTDEKIYEIINKDIETSTINLIKEANELGGNDNITTIVIQNN